MTRFYLTLASVALLSAALATPLTYAAEASKSEANTANSADDKKSATSKPAAAKKDAKKDSKDGGIFIPSEEISEDFAVSFPVDI